METANIYEKHENCLRCNVSLLDLPGWKYCSSRCSKLYLKAQYRKRNTAKIREYNKKYRQLAPDAYFVRSKAAREAILKKMPRCQRCDTAENLNMCHIKPHWAGGTKDMANIIVFCQKCHHQFDETLSEFWKV